MIRKILRYVLIVAIFLLPIMNNYNKNNKLINVSKNNKWGAITIKNKQVIDFKYDFLSQFIDDRAIVMKNSKYGVIDKKDSIIVPFKYDMIFDYSQGFASVKFGKKFGYINKKGEVVIKPQYDFAETFNDDLALVQIKEKWGYINSKNEVIIPITLKNAKNFNDGIASISPDGKKWFLINKKGEKILKEEFDTIYSYNSKEASVCKFSKTGQPKCGIISVKNGKTIIPFKYKAVNLKSENLYAAKKQNNNWVFINSRNKEKSKEYSLVYDYKKNLAIVCSQWDKCGVINKKGKEVIPVEYEIVSPFYQGIIAVMKNGKWGFLNKKGKTVIPFEYDWTGLIF